MRTAIVLAVAIVTLSSLPFVSRQNDAAAEESATLNAQVAALWPVEVDSKAVEGITKIGDRVVAKTREDIRAADGTAIPEGSQVVGRVAIVSAHDADMRVVFDRAELKNGESTPIQPVAIRVGKGLPMAASQ